LSFDAVSPPPTRSWPFSCPPCSPTGPSLSSPNLKTQEVFQQDIQTWLGHLTGPTASSPCLPCLQRRRTPHRRCSIPPGSAAHEARLPHVDVISDRLETLVALAQKPVPQTRVIVASVTALLEKTLPPSELERRTRRLQKGQHADPLDLMEWLETQGYEPEARSRKKAIFPCAAVFLTSGP